MPERIQLRRTKGWRKPEGAIVVSRPSRWGNPFVVGSPYFVMDIRRWQQGDSLATAKWRKYTAKDAVECYERWLGEQVGPSGFAMTYEARTELGGHDLACWCPLDAPCHADVLLAIANAVGVPSSTEGDSR